MATFDPYALTPAASLNRTRFADAAYVDAELRDLPAFDMLSAAALRRQIATEAKNLRIESAMALNADLLPNLDACLAASDASVRSAAIELGRRFGRYVAFLVLTLVTPASSAGLSDEAATYRVYWNRIRHVYLGGGIVSGRLGAVMRDAAHDMLREAGRDDLSIEVAPNATVLPLIGAARSLQTDATAALVADFGGSSVKLAYATYRDAALTSLRTTPLVVVPAAEAGEAGAEKLAGFITDTLTSVWRRSGLALATEVGVCLAAYVRDGQPAEYDSDAGYYVLRRLGANAGEALSQRMSRAVGETIHVRLSHDGTTAARALAGTPDAALIMLGTALGVGFVPPEHGLRAIASGFRVDAA